MKTLSILACAAALLVGGCALNAAVLRVMDYGGALPSITGRGCAVHQSGREHAFARVLVRYEGENCTVQILATGEEE